MTYIPPEYVRSPLLWSGSKYSLLPQILPRIVGRCWEPFCGSAVVSLNYQGESVISDRCGPLMNFWAQVKAGRPFDSFGDLSEAFYYQVREDFNRGVASSSYIKADQFLYLNRTCWRGLYRENSKGEFNVPWGARKRVEWPSMPDMSRVTVIPGSTNYWEAEVPGSVDTILVDSPYIGTHDYGVRFDHEKLAEWCKSQTCRVIVCNTPAACELYPGWSVTPVQTRGGIGRNRQEVILCNEI